MAVALGVGPLTAVSFRSKKINCLKTINYIRREC